MKKKIIFFCSFCFLLFALFPQGNDYIAIRDTPIYKMKSNWNGIYYDAEETLKEDDHVKLYGNVVSDIAKLYGDVVSGIFINIYSAEGEGLRVSANDIKSVKSKQVIENKYLSVPEDETDTVWVREYLLKMIGNQNIQLALDYQPQLKGYGEANVYDDGWYAEVLREPMIITNAEIGLGLSGNIENTVIENTDNGFIIYSNGTLLDKEEFSGYEFETDELKRFEFKFDGDYCNIYLSDFGTPLLSFVKLQISEYQKLKKLIEVPREVFFNKYQDYNEYENQLEEYLKQNTINLDEFIWPRHADGSCDYDANGNMTASASDNPDTHAVESAIPKPAPALGKTAGVTENLRLRTDDKATAEVVTTLAAGTRVRVLAHGRADTIDDIASSWVQVEVLGDAKDKDGNAIERGTTGWLFGGYLAETEDPAESESLDTEEAEATNTPASRRGSHLPIVPMAAGVVVLAVIVAVIVLATKKKEAGKK